MTAIVTEISVFAKNSRKVEHEFRNLMAGQAIDALEERLKLEGGAEAKTKATKALRQMKALDSDLIQFHVGDRRVRIKQTAK